MDKIKEKEKETDLKLMKDPISWYNWPILPVKRMTDNGRSPESGFLLATGKPIVYLKNIFDLHDIGIKSVKEITEKIESREYPSFECIVNDGWMVD